MVVVNLVDNLKVARQEVFHHAHGPPLQGLGQHGVVGVRKDLRAHLPGLRPGEALQVKENPHQLWDGHGGVSVVQLDGNLRTEMKKKNKKIIIKKERK